MTRLPHESWQVIARPDLPEYELGDVCQHPDCDTAWKLEDHHVWRRSFGSDFRDAWWVEIPSGVLVANRTHFCPKHHQMLTQNEAALSVLEDEGGGWTITWTTSGHIELLDPQPQGGASGRAPADTEAEGRSAMQLTVEGEEKPHDEVCEEQHGVETTCTTCKGTGKVRKRPRRQEAVGEPQTATRKKTTWSVRVPRDERENGHDVLTELLDGAIEKCHEAKMIRDINKGANYHALVTALVFFLQNFDAAAQAAES